MARRDRRGGSRGSRGRRPSPGGRNSPGERGAQRQPSPGRKPARSTPAPDRDPGAPQRDAASHPADSPRIFRLGIVPGVMPGKWVERWQHRFGQVPLELVHLEVNSQRRAIDEGEVDAALIRLPIDHDGLHLVRLYDEVPVVVCSRDSALTVVDELDPADLAGETLFVPGDDVLGGFRPPGTEHPRFDAPATTADTITTVAAGVGICIVPMSLARLHHRRDVAHRPLRDGPASTVALAWRTDRDTDDVQAFVGITRGRTPNSSR